MIPDLYINRYETWGSRSFNERDLILNWIIVILFRHFPEVLAIRGGTALYKLLVKPQPRFSEDIDLIFTRKIEPEETKEVSETIQEILNPCLGEPKIIKPIKQKTLIHSLKYEPESGLNIKVEINIQNSFTELGFQDIEFESRINWNEGAWDDISEKVNVKTYYLHEMIATKLHMLYELDRNKARDLFDLWYVLEHLKIKVNFEEIFRCFHAHVGSVVSPKQFNVNLEKKLTRKRFKEDINLLFKPEDEIPWDFDSAIEYLRKSIIAKLS